MMCSPEPVVAHQHLKARGAGDDPLASNSFVLIGQWLFWGGNWPPCLPSPDLQAWRGVRRG